METDAYSILNIGEESEELLDSPQKRKTIGDVYRLLNERLQSLTSSIKTKEKVTFFQLLAIMIEAGVPLVKALYVLASQMNNPRFKRIIATLSQKVESGKTFSSALEDFHGLFTDTEIGMVRAGEASGRLTSILQQVATQEEKNAAVTSKIKGAMIYPIVVSVIMFGSIMMILGFVVPQLLELFTQSGSELPTSTKILIALSDLVVNYYALVLGGAVVLFGSIYLWKKTESGRYHWHNILLRLPVFGQLLRYLALARFTRTLGSLLSSGITIVKALQIDADSVGNAVYRKRILLAAEDVSRGIPLAENLTDSHFLFPEMVVSMIAIGEQTAELSGVSDKIANYYDQEVDQMASNMSKLLEPIIMVVMGGVIGGLVISVMQPIFSLLDVVGSF